jgi:hypothetical protein
LHFTARQRAPRRPPVRRPDWAARRVSTSLACSPHEQKSPQRARHLHQIHHPGPEAGWLGRVRPNSRRGQLHQGPHHRSWQAGPRGKAKRADYILYYKPNIPLAIIEAKDNNHSIGDGIQQAIEYATTLNIPFVFSSNGDGFLFHDRTGASPQRETTLPLESFPTPAGLWARYRSWKGITPEAEPVVLQDYFEDPFGKAPRYYQCNAVNTTIEAITKGVNRILLVMATGTGKTYTAFQIIWRLWKAGRKKRILYLADRNVLVDQTMVNDFRPFGAVMAKLSTKAKTIEREDGTEGQLTTALDKPTSPGRLPPTKSKPAPITSISRTPTSSPTTTATPKNSLRPSTNPSRKPPDSATSSNPSCLRLCCDDAMSNQTQPMEPFSNATRI